MNTIGILGMIFVLYAIDYWINVNYIIFRDEATLIIILLTLSFCVALKYLIILIGKKLKIW
jgi:hypothetical protein